MVPDVLVVVVVLLLLLLPSHSCSRRSRASSAAVVRTSLPWLVSRHPSRSDRSHPPRPLTRRRNRIRSRFRVSLWSLSSAVLPVFYLKKSAKKARFWMRELSTTTIQTTRERERARAHFITERRERQSKKSNSYIHFRRGRETEKRTRTPPPPPKDANRPKNPPLLAGELSAM